MLLRFGVRNHLSLRGSESVTFVRSALDDVETGLIPSAIGDGKEVLPAIIIYGANASGKSNLVDAMSRMQRHVLNSHSQARPDGGVSINRFLLSEAAKTESSAFEIDFVLDKTRYHYAFSTDGERFDSEWLYSFPANRKQKLFERDGGDFSFGRALKGQNKIIAELTRPNSLFVSTAAQNGHSDLTEIYRYIGSIEFISQIMVQGVFASTIFREIDIDNRVIAFLHTLNTGVSEYRRREEQPSEMSTAFYGAVAEVIQKFTRMDPEHLTLMNSRVKVELGHQNEIGELEFFDLDRESAGTRRLLVVLKPVFEALDRGSVVVIDELDASLHTQAAEAILFLFLNQHTNPKGAQLIATVHDTNLLASNILRRDQIWFAQKNEAGVTSLFPLTDIKTRKGENLEKGYLEGRYGAIPFSGSVSAVFEML